MTEDLTQNIQIISNVISASPVGITIYDDSGQSISTNDFLARIIVATKQQVLNQNYNNIEFSKKSRLLDTARKIITTDSPICREVITISSFEKKVFLDCYLFPFSRKDLLFMAQDITERKQTHEKLSQNERF
ncbi:MAG: PAS domain S-box protein [Thermodesulfobacteriota bacterium]|nr:PAS domain S-box protein [Thermodesulfobacteriota bacterium]